MSMFSLRNKTNCPPSVLAHIMLQCQIAWLADLTEVSRQETVLLLEHLVSKHVITSLSVFNEQVLTIVVVVQHCECYSDL